MSGVNRIQLYNEEDFSVLYNMVQELVPLGIDPLVAFQEYKAFFEQFKEIHDKVMEFSGFDYLFNLPDKDVLRDGVIFASFHFSKFFRFVVTALPEIVYGKDADASFNVLLSEHSRTLEIRSGASEQWLSRIKVRDLVAENPSVGLSIYKVLHRGESLLVFLDADIGTGENAEPLEVSFLYNQINIRPGLFAIAERVGKPIIPVVATSSLGRPALHFGIPCYVRGNATSVANTVFRFFSTFLLANPAQWTQWQSHHYRSAQQENIKVGYKEDEGKGVVVLAREKERILLDLLTGELFHE